MEKSSDTYLDTFAKRAMSIKTSIKGGMSGEKVYCRNLLFTSIQFSSVQFIYFTNSINTNKIHLQSKCTIQVEKRKKTRNHLQKSNLTIRKYTVIID